MVSQSKLKVPQNGQLSKTYIPDKGPDVNNFPVMQDNLILDVKPLHGRSTAMNRTELSIADRVVTKHGIDIRYCPQFKNFFIWNNSYWQLDCTGQIQSMVRDIIVIDLPNEIATLHDTSEDTRKEFIKFVSKSQTQSTVDNVVRAIKYLPGIPLEAEKFDSHLELLNVNNGTLELETLRLREFRREDYLTFKIGVNYNPMAKCPKWLDFLTWSTVDDNRQFDKDYFDFKHRLYGSILSGNQDQVFCPAYGTGSNGKTTEYEVLRKLLGGYAVTVDPSTLMTKDRSDGSTATPDIVDFKGKLLAIAGEGEDNQHLADAFIKRLSGGDTFKARRLYEGTIEFTSRVTLFYHTNYKPIIKDNSSGMWRRCFPLPFFNKMDVNSPNRVKHLDLALLEESEGILNWILEGYRKYKENSGIGTCPIVEQARIEYREDMDIIGQFVKECCYVNPSYTVTYKDIYQSYRMWCEESGVVAMKKMRFKAKLNESGFKCIPGTDNNNYWHGIGLISHNPQGKNQTKEEFEIEQDYNDPQKRTLGYCDRCQKNTEFQIPMDNSNQWTCRTCNHKQAYKHPKEETKELAP